MPEPARVYCDFENNFPNFYLFKGFAKDKKQVLEGTDTPEGIRRNCGQLGLEPAEIKSESVFLKVLKYLRDSGSASEDGLAIPIAYKYENGAEAPYRSFNDRESDVCLDSFKKYIKPSHIQVDPLYGDAFVLSEETDKVKKVNLKDQKIRGVVCSPNDEVPSPNEAAEIRITCKDDINTVSANIGSTLSYICPVGC